MFIDLLPTEDQSLIRDSIVALVNDNFPVERMRKDESISGAAERATWNQLVELGLFGLGLSEEAGGIGYSTAEEVIACREFGRNLVSPLVLSSMLTAHVAGSAGNTSLLENLVAGKIRVAFANPLTAVNLAASETIEVQLMDANDGDYVLLVDDKQGAVFDAAALKVSGTHEGLDETIKLQRAMLNTAKPTAVTAATDAAVPRRMALLMAAYATGIAEATRDMAVEYAKIREQFGQPIGAFQAIKHACADMAVRAEIAMAQTFFAAAVSELQSGADMFEAASARLLACDAAVDNAKANIQIHGGMGYTFECDAHLYLKRAHVIAALNSSRRTEQKRILESAGARF